MGESEALTRQSTRNSTPYYQRRAVIERQLRAHGPDGASCAELVAETGIRTDEMRAKLMSLRTDGLATYDAGVWRASGRG